MGIGRDGAQDQVDEWLARIAPGQSVVDIGGIGEFSTNERCSWARRNGATRVAMADLEPFAHPLWQHWRTETARLGVTGVEEFEQVNLDDPALPELIGQWDVVHSTGILYHVPNPVHTLLNLRRTVKRWLIVNTVVLPPVIENRAGRLRLPDCAVALFAALRGQERAVIGEHYRARFGMDIEALAPTRQEGAVMPYMREGAPSYYPYWWIFTAHAFEALLETLEMKVRERWTWEEHAHFVLLEKA
ncbi:class I SAM-dependent methyltransferase [Roseococcus sp. DSY-14]|uniref:class I SAM-dependent methyltransferase n=1 Tax=Roseococcus sp. DSY-14 TaxID=3369650 RepID=UPI00387B099E